MWSNERTKGSNKTLYKANTLNYGIDDLIIYDMVNSNLVLNFDNNSLDQK